MSVTAGVPNVNVQPNLDANLGLFVAFRGINFSVFEILI